MVLEARLILMAATDTGKPDKKVNLEMVRSGRCPVGPNRMLPNSNGLWPSTWAPSTR
jgi:hypothetical protein